eukprot:GHVH01004471.1.p1 GENE.GHVH01004471.1~~GHVH01004471.1.p1  ORF type:complete len:448 (+),score=69.36 GHVH01004471.1:80-1423(+)
MRRRQNKEASPEVVSGGDGGFLDPQIEPRKKDAFVPTMINVVRSASLTVDTDDVMETINDCVTEVKEELSFWKEILSCEIYDDPVFDEMVKAFREFDDMLSSLSHAVSSFLMGVDSLRYGMERMSDTLFDGVTNMSTQRQFHEDNEVNYVRSQVIMYKQYTQSIVNKDAPKSAYSKLKRDINFNIAKPLKEFVFWSSDLKGKLSYRKRLLSEYQLSSKEVSNLHGRHVSSDDVRLIYARNLLVSTSSKFSSIDRHCYVWLSILEDFRIDIWDSMTQTLKHVQYEFFNSSASIWKESLPKRTEFRPLVEMTPRVMTEIVEDEELRLRVNENDALQEELQGMTLEDMTSISMFPYLTKGPKPSDCVVTATARRISANGGSALVKEKVQKVDPLSLNLLLIQGFDRTIATNALLKTNDVQVNAEWSLIMTESSFPCSTKGSHGPDPIRKR